MGLNLANTIPVVPHHLQPAACELTNSAIRREMVVFPFVPVTAIPRNGCTGSTAINTASAIHP